MSNEPRRLLDDPETPEGLKSDLSRARDADVDYDVEAGLSRLRSAIGGPGGGDPGSGPGAGTSVAAGKLATIGIATVAVVATGYFLLKRPEPIQQPAPILETPH